MASFTTEDLIVDQAGGNMGIAFEHNSLRDFSPNYDSEDSDNDSFKLSAPNVLETDHISEQGFSSYNNRFLSSRLS